MKLPKMMLLLSLAVTQSSFAQTIIEQIEKHENELSKIKANLDAVNVYHGMYRRVRDDFYQGNDGVVAQFGIFSNKCAAWLDKWKELKEVTNLVDQVPQNNILLLAEKINSAFLQQTNGVRDLEVLALKIGRDAKEGLRLIDTTFVRPVPANFNQNYQPYVTAILNDVIALKGSLEKITSLTSPLILELRSVEEPSKTVFLDRIRDIIIASGKFPLEAAMNAARNAIKVEEMIDANLMAVKKIEDELNFQILKRRIHHASEKLAELQARVAQARQEISSSGLSDTQRGLDWLNSSEQLASANYQTVMALGKPAAMYQQWRIMKLYFKDKCTANPAKYNCDLLKTLSQLSRDQIEGMSDNEFKALENGWDQVGPVVQDSI